MCWVIFDPLDPQLTLTASRIQGHAAWLCGNAFEVAAPPDGDSCRRYFTPVLAVGDYGGFWRAVVVKGENWHGTLFLDNKAAQKPRKSIGWTFAGGCCRKVPLLASNWICAAGSGAGTEDIIP
jgi:hypothetical protein